MSGPRRRPAAGRPNQRRRPAPVRDFWGNDKADDDPRPVIRRSDHSTALIQSLGPPPFPGGEVAQHYFAAVYDRAAALAVALATSAGLFETEDPD